MWSETSKSMKLRFSTASAPPRIGGLVKSIPHSRQASCPAVSSCCESSQEVAILTFGGTQIRLH
jgi:hypothetical protein